jgi:hypothetical protein
MPFECFYCNFQNPFDNAIDATEEDHICSKGHIMDNKDTPCDDYESEW